MSRSKLQDGARLVPFGSMCVRQAHPADRRLVGRANSAPLTDRAFEVGAGPGGVACGQPHLAMREDRRGRQRPALEDCCDARELLGGRSGPLDVPGGDLNLHLRREQRRPAEV